MTDLEKGFSKSFVGYSIMKEKYYNAQTRTVIEIICPQCKNPFTIPPYDAKRKHKQHKTGLIFCSNRCFHDYRDTKVTVFCKQCNKEFKKLQANVKRSKNNFCSHSCAAIYNNQH